MSGDRLVGESGPELLDDYIGKRLLELNLDRMISEYDEMMASNLPQWAKDKLFDPRRLRR